MPTNDNDFPTQDLPPMPDAHGHAALLLVESLIHELRAQSIISTADAINVVESADSVQIDVAEAADGHAAPMWQSHALLSAIARSLKIDLNGSPTPPHPAPRAD